MPRTSVNEYLSAELQVFAAEFVRDRAASLRRRGAVASGDLAQSLAYEVRAQALGAGVQALIAFEESGRFIDMRRLQPAEGGADYITNLIGWIEKKGLKQKMIDGYMARRKLKTVPENVMTYLAFGIAKKRFNGKYKRTRWYNKAKTGQLAEVYDRVLAGMPDVIFEELKKGFVPTDRRTSTRGSAKAGRSLLVDYAKGRGRQ